MADNFTTDAGSGGDTFGADDIGGVKFPRSKLIIGADGTNDGDVSSANPLPVTGTITAVTAITNAVAVTNAGLTELAAAINSNQIDVNIATDSVGIGGGTQYTEDAAAAANPVGNALILVREDARAGSLTSTDGDNVALRGNNKGEAYVIDTDGNALLGTIDADTGGILTAVQLIDDAVYAEDVGAQAADKGIAVLAVRRDADTSLVGTDNDYANLQVDANGYLKVEIFDGGGSHTVDNAGTFAVQVDGNALTALQLIDDPVVQDDAGFTPGTTKVMMAGFEADEGSTDSVDEGDGGAARMTLDRKVIVNPQPHTAGGLTTARSLDLDESEEQIKATAGQVYGWNITNRHTATLYVKFYNDTAANVEVGTTTPLFTLAIPGNASDATMLSMMGTHGIAFDTAITWAATTGFADNDTGAPGANLIMGTVWYK